MLEWIRFSFTAVFLLLAVITFTAGVIGVYRFGFVMNRMHAGGLGDTQGLLFVILALMFSSGSFMDALKLILILVFMWFTSPASTHFLSQIEYYTNPHLYDHVKREALDGNDRNI